MKSRVRKMGDWNQWKSQRAKHNLEIVSINIAVIVAVFVIAAFI